MVMNEILQRIRDFIVEQRDVIDAYGPSPPLFLVILREPERVLFRNASLPFTMMISVEPAYTSSPVIYPSIKVNGKNERFPACSKVSPSDKGITRGNLLPPKCWKNKPKSPITTRGDVVVVKIPDGGVGGGALLLTK